MAPKKNLNQRNEINPDLSWAAGFFDGEGWIGTVSRWMQSCDRIRLRLAIAQTDRQDLDRIQKAICFGSVRGPYNQKGMLKNPQWKFEIGTQLEIIKAFNLLAPFLYPVKYNQGSIAIEKWVNDQSNKKKPGRKKKNVG